MTGRTRLSWVTALTVASLLLGAGTLNALADNHGKGHGGGSGKVEQHDVQSSNQGHGNAHEDKHHEDDDDDVVAEPAKATDEAKPGKGCGDMNHEHERHDECNDKHQGDGDDDGGGGDDDSGS